MASDSRSLVQAQPDPTKNDRPAMWPLVMADLDAIDPEAIEPILDENGLQAPAQVAVLVDMRDRDRGGLERYGTRLQPFNGRDSLVDAYQELLDACVYLRTAIYEEQESEDREHLKDLYGATLHSALVLRSLLWRRDGQ